VTAWHEEPIFSRTISKKHDREAFDCGDEALNEFLRRYARKSHERGGAKTLLAISDTDKSVLGFYSLSPGFGGLCANAGDCAARAGTP